MFQTCLRATVALTLALTVRGENLKPDDVKVVGALDYGETSDPIDVTETPRYSAFIFNAKGGDHIDITVKGKDRQATVAIADGALHEMAAGVSSLNFTIPDNGPDPQAYYIVFRDSEGKSATFTVSLMRAEKKSAL